LSAELEPAALIREANALRLAGRDAEAEAVYLRLLSRWPALPDAWFNLGVVQRRIGRFEAALGSYEEALARGIRGPEEVHLNRAFIYSDCLGDEEAAARELGEALRLNPAYVPALLNLAKLHEDHGDRAQARALYERALTQDPPPALALARLANLLPREELDDTVIERLRAAMSRPDTFIVDRAALGFALGRVLDGLGRYRAAFTAYQAANRDSRASALPTVVRYDRAAQELVTQQLLSTPLPAALPFPTAEAARPRPIFICGMFRSGSTLIEQLIAAAPGVEPGGELNLIPGLIVRELLPYPQALASAPHTQLERLAGEYRKAIGGAFPGAAYVTDKRPDNFFCIGLIKTLFPDALIVHTTRNPLDTCLSMFFLHLDLSMSYALDLLDTGHFYRQYRTVMAHWKKVYGSDIVDFDYDTFIRTPEPSAARLFAALGLSWDPRFLEAPAQGRSVRTASVWQVREPLYPHSSGRARHYEAELVGLREYLGDLLPATPAAEGP
jgi:hypothetical protein